MAETLWQLLPVLLACFTLGAASHTRAGERIGWWFFSLLIQPPCERGCGQFGPHRCAPASKPVMHSLPPAVHHHTGQGLCSWCGLQHDAGSHTRRADESWATYDRLPAPSPAGREVCQRMGAHVMVMDRATCLQCGQVP